MNMKEWFLGNISNIDSVISIITSILGGIAFVGGAIVKLLKILFQVKVESKKKYYYLRADDNEIKESMRCYIPTRVQDIDPCTNGYSDPFISKKLVPYFIDDVFKNSSSQYFIILADSGMGKTTCLLRLFLTYYKKLSKKHDIMLIPLSLEGLLEIIRKIEDKQNTILLLDGFDEDDHAINNYSERLKIICDETELFYKVIITCRTQFFPDSKAEPKHTGKIKYGGNKGVEFMKYYISPFNESEIDLYLKKKYHGFFGRKKIEQSKKVIKNCPELMVRPMLLSYIDDLISDDKKEYRYTYEVYNELVSKWMTRESLDDQYKEKMPIFIEKVAEYMYSNKTDYVSNEKIKELCDLCDIKINITKVKSRSLLNRNSGGYYKFAHRSILEYILAKKAYNDKEFRKMLLSNGLIGYNMTKLFLEEMVDVYLKKRIYFNDSKKKLISASLECFQLTHICFKGMILIGCKFKECDLTGVDFSESVVSESDFSGSDLKNTNFSKANLQNIDLSRADLSGALMREAELGGAKLNEANLNWANLGGVVLDGADLSKANLESSCLLDASLHGVNLRGANLENASLDGVDLRKSIIENTKFKYLHIGGALVDESQFAYFEEKYDLQGKKYSNKSDIWYSILEDRY